MPPPMPKRPPPPFIETEEEKLKRLEMDLMCKFKSASLQKCEILFKSY
jgi:hypothetical protein